MSSKSLLPILAASASVITARQEASPGCGIEKDFIGSTREFSIQSGGLTRTFRVHLPEGHAVNVASPMVVAYHGQGQQSAGFEDLSRLGTEALNPDMIAVIPQGVDDAWQGPTYATPGVDDYGFTADLLDYMSNNFCVAAARTYALGYSNGGGFVAALARDAGVGSRFAAFATVNGAYYGDLEDSDCSPGRSPIPFWSTHGTGDDAVPYQGTTQGAGGELPAIPDWTARWAARSGCEASVTRELDNAVDLVEWDCEGDEKLQQHYRINGGDHGYPTQDGPIDASRLAMDFLARWSK